MVCRDLWEGEEISEEAEKKGPKNLSKQATFILSLCFPHLCAMSFREVIFIYSISCQISNFISVGKFVLQLLAMKVWVLISSALLLCLCSHPAEGYVAFNIAVFLEFTREIFLELLFLLTLLLQEITCFSYCSFVFLLLMV